MAAGKAFTEMPNLPAKPLYLTTSMQGTVKKSSPPLSIMGLLL